MADVTITDPRQRHELSDRATKRVFKRLIPFLLLMYVIAFLDRSNVSFAQKEFEVDFGISAASYAFCAGLFFVGYAIFEVPSNLLFNFDSTLGGNAGLYSLAFGAVMGAVLFAITALFKKANEVEAGHLDEVDAHHVPHDQAEAARGPHRRTAQVRP
jgi:hypothetical protein